MGNADKTCPYCKEAQTISWYESAHADISLYGRCTNQECNKPIRAKGGRYYKTASELMPTNAINST